MTAVINPSSTDATNEGASDLQFFRRMEIAVCNRRFVNPAGAKEFQDCSTTFYPDFGGPAAAPPFTLSGNSIGTQSTWTATAPSTNVIAIDATAQANPDPVNNPFNGSGSIFGEVIFDLTFTKPGTFNAEVNTSWLTTFGPSTTGSAGGNVLQGLSTQFGLSYQYYPPSTSNTLQQTVHIDSARVVRLNLQYFVSQSSSATVKGSGRVFTMTFVPD